MACCSEIIDYLDQRSCKNHGLLVGNYSLATKKIIIGVDLTDVLINYAIEKEAHMIITLYPFWFNKLKKITNQGFRGRTIIKLIKHEICYYASGTDLDFITLNNDLLELLELEKINKKSLELDKRGGVGLIGCVKESISLKDFAEFVKERLKLERINFYGDKDCFVNKVALYAGSGMAYLDDLVKTKSCDVYLTGDITSWDVLNGLDSGLNLIDITNHASTKGFVKNLKCELEKEFKNSDLEIICCEDIDMKKFHAS